MSRVTAPRRLLLALAGAALLCLAAPGSATAATGETPQKHFLWKVAGGSGTVFLFGTIHAGKPDFYPLPAVVEDSFKQADFLVEEIDPNEANEAARAKQIVAQRGVYTDGDSIANHLTEATRGRLANFVDKAGQSATLFAHVKPWLASLLVTQLDLKRQGFDPKLGLDKHFLNEAEQAHKPIKALETAEFQLEMFISFDADMQNRMLFGTLVATEDSEKIYDPLVAAWRAGDADAVERLMNRTVAAHPELQLVHKRMFDDRNDAMTKKIEDFLQTPKTYFVAVGAGHMVGEHGIVAQLRRRNFRVEQP